MTKGTYAANVLLVVLLAATIKAAHGQSLTLGHQERTSQKSLAVVMDPDSDHAAVAEHLVALKSNVGPFVTAETTERMGDAARQRLTGIQHYSVVTRAIDLVAALGDTETLERIATDSAAVEMLGFSEPEMIQWVQQKARDHLDLEPLPQPSRSSVTPSSQSGECADTDVVAGQLCTIATNEPDPFLRADLWLEYQEYTQLVALAR